MDKKTIVVIGENWEAQMMAACALEAAGYDAVTLFDRRNALRAVRDLKPDLVLLDMSMPKLKSWQLLKTLRRDAHTQGVPIIGIVPHNEFAEAAMVAGGGLIDVYSRPMDNRSLIRKVRRVLKDDGQQDHFQHRAVI